jgi:hypothetical protein
MQNSLDLDGEAKNLNQAYWIGNSKVYPKYPPADLAAYCESLHEIPEYWITELLIKKEVPVMTFIMTKLPSRRSALLAVETRNCFRSELPSENPGCLLLRNIPSQHFLQDAKLNFNQRILDGARSFQDPDYKGGPLPLWTINFWTQMNGILDAQKMWQTADKWLMNHTDNSARRTVIDKCRQYLANIGWNTRLGRTRLTDLAPILGDTMTTGAVVDLLVESLSLEISQNNTATEFGIVGLTFMDMVAKGWKTRGKDLELVLNRGILMMVEDWIKTGKRRILLFPVHLQAEQHYVGFKIDFRKREISYGKSVYSLVRSKSDQGFEYR